MLGRFTATGQEGEDLTEEISRFIQMIGLEEAAPGRYSMLLVLALYGGAMSGKLNPAKVMWEIRALEGLGPESRMKAPIQNKHQPLKGLWHKHFMGETVAAVAANIRKGLGRFGIPYAKSKVEEARISGVEGFFSVEDLKAIAEDVVHGHWNRLSEQQALTGEWLVFARHEERNYYLGLTTHENEQHEVMRQQIDRLCCAEFPFLAQLLADAAADKPL
jgi:hypothetical protein